ncbi:MAG: rhomboid family intramembrane serine protease [Deltaproteobacteria bacterium]|nr:rhomboid family intramembrane serine protease [Deltaproteobacteria bacterium]
MGAWHRLVQSWRRLPRVIRVLLALQAVSWALLLPLSSGFSERALLLLGLSTAGLREGHVWQLLTHPVVHAPADFFGLLFDGMLLWVLGSVFARRWRVSHFLFFLAACSLAGAGTGLLAHAASPGAFMAVLTGMDAAVRGLFMAFHLVFGGEYVRLIGLAQPVRARWVLYVVVALDVLFFVAGSNPDLGVQVGGLLAGWLLVTGRWRPRKLRTWISARWMDAAWERRRRRFRVVGGAGPH